MRGDVKESGLTAKSFAAIVLALVLQAILVHLGTIHLAMEFPFEHVIPLPALLIVLVFSLLSGVGAVLLKARVLNRAELTCILFALVLSAPLMSQSLWHRMASILASSPRSNSLENMESMGDKIWPHGPNVIPGIFEVSNADRLLQTGDIQWQEQEQEDGRPVQLPVLTARQDEAVLAVPISRGEKGRIQLVPGTPYFISTLLRFESGDPDTEFFCRLRYGDEGGLQEVFRGRRSAGPTFQHPSGFQREGRYGVELPRELPNTVYLEFGIRGEGQLELQDPKMFSVAALEQLYQGREVLSESDWRALPPELRAAQVYRPDNLFSPAGVRYLLTGMIPLNEWKQPILAWGSFFTLLLITVFTVNVLLRKQWMENERYAMPIGKLAMMFLDENGHRRSLFAQTFWRNRMLWTGFALSLFWVLMRGWNFYNPNVPDMNVDVSLSTYFGQSGLAPAFQGVTFSLSVIFLAVGLLMELNILMSLVVGFWIFRSLYWIGEITGLDIYTSPSGRGYPWGTEMQVGGFIAYGLVILIFTRKYLAQVVRSAFTPGDPMSRGEALSYRTCLILFFGSLLASIAWAEWMGVSKLGIFLTFSFLIILCVVCSKIRAECGVPFGYFGTGAFSLLLFVNLVGGMPVFDHTGVMLALIISFFVGPTPFLLLPGAQMEMLEIGNRFGIRPRHLTYTMLLGIFGGIVIGGWIFLSGSYAEGGDTLPYKWAYIDKLWFFQPFNRMLGDANAAISAGVEPGYTLSRDTIGFVLGAVLTVILSVIRQLHAAFTFHPAGLLLAPSWMLGQAWGSIAMAWFIRWLVLKMGGAATVREKLMPVAAGLFLGGCVGQLIWGLVAWNLYAQDIELIYTSMP